MTGDPVPADIGDALVEALRRSPDAARLPARCRGLLNDLVGVDAIARRQEIAVLVAAVEAGIPDLLLADSGPAAVDRAVADLAETGAVAADLARWAVTTWVRALRGEVGLDEPVRGPDRGRHGLLTDDRSVGGGGTLPPSLPGPVDPRREGGDLDDRRERVGQRPEEPGDQGDGAAMDPSRISPRGRIMAGAAIGAIAVLVVGFLALSGGGGGSDPPPKPAKSVAVERTTLGSGLLVARTVTVKPGKDQPYTEILRLENTTDHQISYMVDEVIPKGVGTTEQEVGFSPTPTVLDERPLVIEYRGGLAGGDSVILAVSGELDNETVSARSLLQESSRGRARYGEAHAALRASIAGPASCKMTDNCYYYGAVSTNSTATTGTWTFTCSTQRLPFPPMFVNFDKYTGASCTITLSVRDPAAGAATATFTVAFVP